ncbi:MAG: glutamate synthase, partial [Candidatus Promineifilaceae bacterium]
MNASDFADKLIASRPAVISKGPAAGRNLEAEGGCGVIGIACSEPLSGRHLLQALDQMKNRGNGKGGGIAAVGLEAAHFGVTQAVLDEDYLLALAYLEPDCRPDVEHNHLRPTFEIDHVHQVAHMDDYRALPGLEVQPPEVVIYFGHVRPEVRQRFAAENGLADAPARLLDDEIVYQNTQRLNQEFYSAAGRTRAFVLSHGRNLLVLKMVGFGDGVIRYYQLEGLRAHIWIGHHRYPTKGRVWHPGGAHPFVGLNEALVHNGDFANYASICEYLGQRNIQQLFLTDTEVSVQVFDLLYRSYGYPLEYVVEALAPTTERDYAMLPAEKRHVYGLLQTTHMHSSPDGPWFFLIAQSDQADGRPAYRLTGITDTSMLRPQVFAWQASGRDGPAIGFAASEKQAIDAALNSLASEDGRFWSRADRYWNARGGSHTDGGAFVFTVSPQPEGGARLECRDKFGRPVRPEAEQVPYRANGSRPAPLRLPAGGPAELAAWLAGQIPNCDYASVLEFLAGLEAQAATDEGWRRALETLTWLMDRRYPTGRLRRSSLLSLYDGAFDWLIECLVARPPGELVYD